MSSSQPIESQENTASPAGAPTLSDLEIEAVDLFISMVRLMGMPKSIGELYGLLFVSPEALPMDVLMERLNMSKGAASQGLKLLRSFGAVKTVYVVGDRRDHYQAEVEVSRFATAFIKGTIQPHLDSGLQRLERMEKFAEQLPEKRREISAGRLARLRHWHEKGQEMLPWILKFLVS